MCFEHTAGTAANADHDVRIMPGPAEQQREHRGSTKAAVAPDALAATQYAIDMKSEQRWRHGLAARGHVREPREGAICLEKLESARHGRAGRQDFELGAQAHASERR